FAAVRDRMEQFVANHTLSGVVTVVGNADGIVDIAATGFRELEPQAPMQKDTLFKIASMTKPITGMAIMILADEGQLTPEDPVEKHLPEFRGQMLVAERGPDFVKLKKPKRPITIRDLLTHTSGLPGGYPPGLRDLYHKRNRTLAEATLVASQQPLQFEPGTKWAYCNAGIDTLGRIVEVVSGQSYEAFLKTRIFDPLGMKDTTFYPTPEQAQRVAVVYGQKDGKLIPTRPALLEAPPGSKHPVPAGGLYSTGPDLAKLYQMMLHKGELHGKRILSEKAVETMTQKQSGDVTTGFTGGMCWGYGFAVVENPAGVTGMLAPGSYGHGGAFGTQGWIDPKQGAFFILLIARTGLPNSDNSEIRKAFQQFAVEALKK
ncbi:MAG: beta-lactamase family protein, partial [Bacteroidales bacterium]|nr:beta-lactamase family protein [Bacteroidales bacterium]